MMGLQMLGWGWMQVRGGNFKDRQYLVFTASMLIGQLGAMSECVLTKAWGTFLAQAYFFLSTVWGGITRYQQMKRSFSS